MQILKIVNMDNGYEYSSKALQQFCSQWDIEHKTDIPYNLQGQGIVEHAHGSLKTQIQKINKGEFYPWSPHNALNHALFILKFFPVSQSITDRF